MSLKKNLEYFPIEFFLRIRNYFQILLALFRILMVKEVDDVVFIIRAYGSGLRSGTVFPNHQRGV